MGGNPSRVRVTGPLEPYAVGLALELARVGYTRHSTTHQLRVFAHLTRWLAAESLDVAELTPAVGDAFLTCAASSRLHAVAFTKGAAAAVELLTRVGGGAIGGNQPAETNGGNAGGLWRVSGLRTWSGTVDRG
jgi:hypothetical protein